MNKNVHRVYIGSFFLIGTIITLFLAVKGYSYYTTPVEQRFFLPNHDSLKPSGLLGHGAGIIGSFMMVFGVAVYMVRKRWKKFFRIGYLKHWLEFHIFLCSLGPVLVLYHTAFKFGGIVAISFWSMAAVVLSGVAGRFIYVRIPRTIQGNELNVKELDKMGQELSIRLKTDYSVNGEIMPKIEKINFTDKYRNLSLRKSLINQFKDYFIINSLLKEIKNDLKPLNLNSKRKKEILRLAKSKLIISKRIGMLRIMQKLFKYWHIVHLPFAIIMFLIMAIHIAVAVAFGYTWIF
ncbi:MAG TPA: hypothetical protein VMT35_03200 [Ignavibacteriaceae bacterium]|nr:hypothetical protein [Ignavibacteriaceae bacterium]